MVALNVLDCLGSKRVWPLAEDFVLEGSSVDQICNVKLVSHVGTRSKQCAYPKICRSSVKVQFECLARRPDSDRADVFRIVLLVFCSDISCLAAGGILFLEHLLDTCLSAHRMIDAMLTLLFHLREETDQYLGSPDIAIDFKGRTFRHEPRSSAENDHLCLGSCTLLPMKYGPSIVGQKWYL